MRDLTSSNKYSTKLLRSGTLAVACASDKTTPKEEVFFY